MIVIDKAHCFQGADEKLEILKSQFAATSGTSLRDMGKKWLLSIKWT